MRVLGEPTSRAVSLMTVGEGGGGVRGEGLRRGWCLASAFVRFSRLSVVRNPIDSPI